MALLQGWAQRNKACGELSDPEALRRLKTVCVDTSHLDAKTASEVDAFLAKEKQPGQLLKAIDWELTDTCTTAAAVIRVYFSPTQRHVTVMPPNSSPNVAAPPIDYYEPATQVVLLVYDRPSVKILYRTEAQDKENDRTLLLYAPFSRLVKEMKALGH